MDDENASYSVSSCGTLQNGTVAAGCTTVPLINGKEPVLQGQGGNPELRPYFSTNADVSLEKYFMHNQGKIAIAAYYKRITNFTTQNLNLNSGNVNSSGPQDPTAFSTDCSAFSGLLNGAAPLPNQTYSMLVDRTDQRRQGPCVWLSKPPYHPPRVVNEGARRLQCHRSDCAHDELD